MGVLLAFTTAREGLDDLVNIPCSTVSSVEVLLHVQARLYLNVLHFLPAHLGQMPLFLTMVAVITLEVTLCWMMLSPMLVAFMVLVGTCWMS